MKVQVSLDDELMTKVDAYADKMYLNRSAFISMSCSKFIASMEMQSAIGDMAVTMRRIADNNKIDEQSRKELERFEVLAELFSQK